MARLLIALVVILVVVPLFLHNMERIDNWFRPKAIKEMRKKLAENGKKPQ